MGMFVSCPCSIFPSRQIQLLNLGVLKNVYLFTISIAKYKHRYTMRRGKFHLQPKRNKTLILCEKELCESISPHKYSVSEFYVTFSLIL